MAVRTRFAPSPSGYLHLGSARTALFNWAFARHHEGVMVLRIEDTDRERSTREAEQAVLDGLRWLGLDWDEGPFRQSELAERHAGVIEELLAGGAAYRCVCTRAELEERKQRAEGRRAYDGTCRDQDYGPDCGPHTVRLRLDEDADLSWDDLVFGPSGKEAAEIGDTIIRRSDGGALYNLAVVVDDIDMGISHVIRGADHHANTPLQIAIYRAMGAKLPHFAHVPLIVGPSGKKLSKRRDPVSLQDFRDQGVLPQALRNWLVRIGWSHGDDEIFSQDDIARLFDLDSVGRSAGQADAGKLEWLGMHYIKALPMPELLAALDPYIEQLTGSPAPRTRGFELLLDLLLRRDGPLQAKLRPPPRDVAKLRVAAWLDDPFCPVDTNVLGVLEAAVDSLEASGIAVDRAARPDIDPGAASGLGMLMVGAAVDLAPDDKAADEAAEKSPTMPVLSHKQWQSMHRMREAIRGKWASFFESYDAILMPVGFVPPFEHLHEGDFFTRTLTCNGESRPYSDIIRWTILTGMAYLPATVPPVGLTGAGHPIGMQVVGPHGGDYTTIRLAAEVGRVCGGYRPPPIA